MMTYLETKKMVICVKLKMIIFNRYLHRDKKLLWSILRMTTQVHLSLKMSIHWVNISITLNCNN